MPASYPLGPPITPFSNISPGYTADNGISRDGLIIMAGAVQFNTAPNISTFTNDAAYITAADETDPVVGAVTGIVMSDGAGHISAATSGTNYGPSWTDLGNEVYAQITPNGGSGLVRVTGYAGAMGIVYGHDYAVAGTDFITPTGDGSGLTGVLHTEVDPVVGAVAGIVMADGAGNISAAAAGSDYLAPTGDGSGLTGIVTTLSGHNVSELTNDLYFIQNQAGSPTADVFIRAGYWDGGWGWIGGASVSLTNGGGGGVDINGGGVGSGYPVGPITLTSGEGGNINLTTGPGAGHGGTGLVVVTNSNLVDGSNNAYITSAGIPTNVSSFTNDAGYSTFTPSGTVAYTGDNVSEFTNDAGYLTTIAGLNVSALTNDAGYLITIAGLNVSALTNDAGYLTSEYDPVFGAWLSAGTAPFADNSSGANWASTAPTNTTDAINRIAAALAGLLGTPIP